MSERNPVFDENGVFKQTMIHNGGVRFRCECGCNVFHQPDDTQPHIYKCNSCPIEFERLEDEEETTEQ